MKVLFSVTLALLSLAAFANPALESVQASRNYEARYVNEDLSVSFVNPKFSNPSGGGDIPLTLASDKDGVCRLYGLAAYVESSTTTFSARSGTGVVIGADSRFSQFQSLRHTDGIRSIACKAEDNGPITPSTNWGAKYINDDGSVTINAPKFKMNGVDLHISLDTDKNGVCNLYGYSSYVESSATTDSIRSGKSVSINSDSKFNKYVANKYTDVIASLMCR